MKSPTLHALAAFALLALACTKTEHVTAEPPPPDSESAYPPPSPLPAALAALGAPCNAPVPERSAAQCGRSGQLAVVSTNLPAWPQGLQAMAPLPGRNGARQFEEFPVMRVGLERGRVWVLASCAICRTAVDQVEVVDIALATDAQLADLQARLGMPRSPILRTTRAFSGHLPRPKA